MTEGNPTAETNQLDKDAITLASALHEDWRKTRLQEDGSYDPRVKKTKDEAWASAHGTDEVDIANTEFVDLPSDWQAENLAAAEVVVDLMAEAAEVGGAIDLSNEAHRGYIGERIHDAWLSRNEWVFDPTYGNPDLAKPFGELSEAEQQKDIDQMVMALDLLGHQQ